MGWGCDAARGAVISLYGFGGDDESRPGNGLARGERAIELKVAGAEAGTATATLRVRLKQAVYLTAAQNFARETRLLPRAPGDRRRAGRLEAVG